MLVQLRCSTIALRRTGNVPNFNSMGLCETHEIGDKAVIQILVINLDDSFIAGLRIIDLNPGGFLLKKPFQPIKSLLDDCQSINRLRSRLEFFEIPESLRFVRCPLELK